MATEREIEEVKNKFRRYSLYQEWADAATGKETQAKYQKMADAALRASARDARFFGVTEIDIRGK